jgi:hypothetical protein
MPDTEVALSKVERAIQLIHEAAARRLQNMGRLREARCADCGILQFTYEPPAFIVVRCRRCGGWNKIQDHPPERIS